MAANSLEFNQVSTILNTIQQQVTGRASIAPVDTSTFATAADIVLKTGYDAIYKAIGLVFGPTLMSIRPYDRKFGGLELPIDAWTVHTRKIALLDNTFEDNDAFKWPVTWDDTENPASGDGESVDQQIIKKAKPVQTNFYGANTYQDHYTIFDKPLKVAFSSPAEMGRFIAMITQNVTNMMEQARENFARYTLVNYMGALYDLHSGTDTRVINLLTEYNTLLGLSGADALTAQTVYKPENFPSFIKWVAARIKQISREFADRSIKYQSPINGQYITRHTPADRQRIFLFSALQDQMETMVLSSVFHDDYLKQAYTEAVSFWQNINSPDTINVTPGYMGPAGSPIQGAAVNLSKVFGVIMDVDACGYGVIESTMKAAPYNARGEYQNYFLRDYHKNYCDTSEKGVLLLLA